MSAIGWSVDGGTVALGALVGLGFLLVQLSPWLKRRWPGTWGQPKGGG